ncbi:MAG: flagellar assembly protein A [Gemmatimonadota bacterium]
MAEKRPEKPETAQAAPAAAPDQGKSPSQAAGDVLGGLESLLQEEGSGFQLPDEDLSADELTDLFEEGEEVPPPDASPLKAAVHDRRTERRERRRRDDEEYRNLEASLQASPLGVQISEDRMVVRVSRITIDFSAEDIVQLLKRHNVVSGVDHDAIRTAISKAVNGQIQYEVTVARGTPPKILKPTRIDFRLPRDLITGPNETKTPFELLKQCLEGQYVEACKSWKGPAKLVRKGEVLAELVPAEVEPGCDVHGQTVTVEALGGMALQCGDHTSISEDGMQVAADIYGYAGLIGGVPTVLSPIWVSPDHMEARFVFHPPSVGPPPVLSEAELDELLEMKWIEFGILDKQLELLRKRLEQKQALPTTVPVAQGTPELPGEDAQIRQSYDPYELMKWNQLQSLLNLKDPEALERAVRQIYETMPDEQDPEAVDQRGIRFKALRAGDVVAEKIPATAGVTGKDIQGEDVVPDEGKDAHLEFGEGVDLSDDALRCRAKHFGYVALRWDMEVNVLSPLWIAPNRTAAYFLNLPQSSHSRFPSVEEMQQLIEAAEITHGYSPERWAEILADLEAGRRRQEYLICVAQGSLAQPGQDASFDWAVSISRHKPGRILDDGTIDFRDRNLTTVVKEGDLLGKLVPPKPGSPGKDIFGTQLNPPGPLNIEVVTDSRIYAEPEEDGTMSFFCETGGGISTEEEIKTVQAKSHKRITIGIYPISNIEGDVDYGTGNIDFNGDVVIGGSVQSQFSVKATGTVTIGGYIEAGAYVTAGKDILVQRGVVGSATELVAGGDVMSKFIQEATVRAGGSVKVGSYIFNASVRAGGEVLVPGMGEGKSRALVGGLIWGARGISARSIGSPYNTSTRLVVGVDPDQVNRADQIRANMHACEDKQRKLLKTLGMETLDLDLLKQKLARCASPQQKQAMLVSVKRIAKIAELEKNQEQELAEIAEGQRKLAHQTRINVVSQLFAGVELRIGELTELVREDKDKVSFRLITEDEQTRLQEEVLRNTPRFS